MNNTEIWKDIVGYEGLYQVSNLGNVKSLNYLRIRGKEVILKPWKHGQGYYCVSLSKDGKKINKFIHRLVYAAFNGDIPDDLVINHIDEDKTNNDLNNLEAITQKENVYHGTGIIRNREKQINNLKKSKPVIAWNSKQILFFPSISEVNRELGFCAQAIGDCCKGNYSTKSKNFYKGFWWKYA